ncbi:MAG: hypothetical protein HC801_13645 [Nitrospira sp.]|nr:hypothetical protein [Nitrospira sp.]
MNPQPPRDSSPNHGPTPEPADWFPASLPELEDAFERQVIRREDDTVTKLMLSLDHAFGVVLREKIQFVRMVSAAGARTPLAALDDTLVQSYLNTMQHTWTGDAGYEAAKQLVPRVRMALTAITPAYVQEYDAREVGLTAKRDDKTGWACLLAHIVDNGSSQEPGRT